MERFVDKGLEAGDSEQGDFCFPERYPGLDNVEYVYYDLDVLNARRILEEMPEDEWEISGCPLTFLDRVMDDDLDFMKEHKRQSAMESNKEVFWGWIDFLKVVEGGYEIFNRAMETGELMINVKKLDHYRLFWKLFVSNWTDKVVSQENLGETIASCQRAFLDLFDEGELKEKGYEKPESVSEEDIENAKKLIRSF